MTRSVPTRTLALVISLTASTAVADDADLTAHGLAAMDRATGATGAGADLAFMFGTGDSASGGFASRLDLHGRYVHASGFGGYAAMGVSKTFLSSDDPLGEMLVEAVNDETGVTALEVGGLYRRVLTRDLALVAHAGVTLPTASDGLAAFANILSQQHRMTDLVLAMPETTALRLGVTPAFQRGVVFARADLGVDVILDQPAADPSAGMEEIDPIVHASLAVGASLGKLSTALQLATVGTTGDVDEGEDRFLHAATLEARYDLGRVAPSLAITTPLDDVARGDMLAITAAVATRF
jgi:hypothetical protein